MTNITIRTHDGYLSIAIGTTLKVRYGQNGSQIARVTKITKAGSVYVRKFSKGLRGWSKTDLRILPHEVIGLGEA